MAEGTHTVRAFGHPGSGKSTARPQTKGRHVSQAALNSVRLILGDRPRRRDLLARLGVVPDRIAAPDIDEAPRPAELPRTYALRLAVEKAQAVDRAEGEIVVAGDTTIVLGRRILPPAETEDVQPAKLR